MDPGAVRVENSRRLLTDLALKTQQIRGAGRKEAKEEEQVTRLVVPSPSLLAGAAAVGLARESRAGSASSRQYYERQHRLRRPAGVRAAALRDRRSADSADGDGGREPPWAHDYPTADIHLMKIINELTVRRPARGRLEHLLARRPRADEPPDRLHVGAGVLVR